MVCAAACAVLFCALIFPRLWGVRPLSVLSGSMEPAYPVGSLVYVQACGPEEIREGDVIAFWVSEEAVVTHRVIAVDKEERCFYTKGDANEQPDGQPALFSQLAGRAVFCVPYLGYAAVYLGMPSLRVGLAAALALVLLLPQ